MNDEGKEKLIETLTEQVTQLKGAIQKTVQEHFVTGLERRGFTGVEVLDIGRDYAQLYQGCLNGKYFIGDFGTLCELAQLTNY